MTYPDKYCKRSNSLWLIGLGVISEFANLSWGVLKKLNSLSASLDASNVLADFSIFKKYFSLSLTIVLK